MKNQRFPSLSKLGIALLEHFTQPILGKEAIGEIKAPYQEQELLSSIAKVLESTENRFVSECKDDFVKEAIKNLPLSNLPSITKAAREFVKHPTDPELSNLLVQHLTNTFPRITLQQAQRGMALYIKILREELVSLSSEIRDQLKTLAALRSQEKLDLIYESIVYNDKRLDKSDASFNELHFANITIEKNNKYWAESSEPTIEYYPFGRDCAQYFHLTEIDLYADPSFDITVLNRHMQSLIITSIGVEVVSMTQIGFGRGAPEAVKLTVGDVYILEMPNLWNKYQDAFESSPNPIDVNQVKSIELADPIYLQSNAPYRFELLLDKYIEHMPNNVILRFWIQTDIQLQKSKEIHLFGL